jgi:hypothetical protein
MRLEDTGDAIELFEAHLFEEVRFNSCLKELRLEATGDQAIVANAHKFCDKWGISPPPRPAPPVPRSPNAPASCRQHRR